MYWIHCSYCIGLPRQGPMYCSHRRGCVRPSGPKTPGLIPKGTGSGRWQGWLQNIRVSKNTACSGSYLACSCRFSSLLAFFKAPMWMLVTQNTILRTERRGNSEMSISSIMLRGLGGRLSPPSSREQSVRLVVMAQEQRQHSGESDLTHLSEEACFRVPFVSV